MAVEEIASKLSRRRIVCIITMTLIESFLFGFFLDGWPSLVYMFTNDGVFSEFCANSETSNTSVSTLIGGPYRQILGFGRLSSRYSDAKQDTPNGGLDTITVNPSQFLRLNESNVSLTANGVTMVSCDTQQNLMSLVLVIGSVVGQLAIFFFGWIFDRLGLRKMRLIIFCIMFTGAMLMTFTNTELSPLLFVGAIFLVLSSMLVSMTNGHLALLAGPRQSAVLTLSSMCICLTSFITGIMEMAYDAGVSTQTCLYVYAGVMTIHLLDTLFLMPSYKVTEAAELRRVRSDQHSIAMEMSSSSGQSQEDSQEDGASTKCSKAAALDVESVGENSEALTFKRIIMSTLYVNHVLWFTIIQLNFWYILSSFFPWLSYISAGRSTEVNAQTLIFQYANILVILCPMIGWVTDVVIAYRDKRAVFQSGSLDSVKEDVSLIVTGKDPRKGEPGLLWKAVSLCPVLMLAPVFSTILSAASLFETGEAGVVVSVMTALIKGSLFAPYYLFCQRVYPVEHYGKVVGLGLSFANLPILLAIPIIDWAQTSTPPYSPAQTLLLIMVLLTFIHPLSILVRYARRR